MPETSKYCIGIDLGGTKVLGGVIDTTTGKVLTSIKQPSPTYSDAEGMSKMLIQVIERLLDTIPEEIGNSIKGCGVGVAGQIDHANGILIEAPNLGGGMANVAIAAPLKEHFGWPVFVGNDVEVAALGEGRFGAGRDCPLFACVFVGTGIGGALMVNGERFMGATGNAGEIGHTMVKVGGRLCGCGQKGHLEAYASRTAIERYIRKEITNGRQSILSDLIQDTTTRLRSKALAKGIRNGDVLTIEAMTMAARYLGYGLSSLINFYNPQRIILGGGVIESIDLLFDLAAKRARNCALKAAAKNVEIVRTGLGEQSGVIGAALLVKEI